ncbi:MAG: hypothetical protein ACO1SV_27340 [Fimbriimonas sp.]
MSPVASAMYLCLRVDLDYVPWDTPDAGEFGHGEPAMLIRLLEVARFTGLKFHFFASERALRAFPANAEAVLNDGHDLDWLCKRADQGEERLEEARALFSMLGHVPRGLAVRTGWPADAAPFEGLNTLQFISATPGPVPPGLIHFPVETRPVREALRSGMSVRTWTDATKTQLRDAASRRTGVTVCVRPQVLSRFDARLSHLREILEMARAVDLPVRTLRELLRPDPS